MTNQEFNLKIINTLQINEYLESNPAGYIPTNLRVLKTHLTHINGGKYPDNINIIEKNMLVSYIRSVAIRQGKLDGVSLDIQNAIDWDEFANKKRHESLPISFLGKTYYYNVFDIDY